MVKEWKEANVKRPETSGGVGWKLPTVNSESLRLQVTQRYNGFALRLTNGDEVPRDGGCFYHAIIHGLG